MSSRQLPLAIYSSKRRQRSISNPHSRPVNSSSPLKPLASDADTTVEEMSKRMMKRSRRGLKRSFSGSETFKSASVGASPIDRPLEEARPAKRSKASARAPLQTILEPSHNTPLAPLEEEGSADMDLTDVVELKTPAPREDPANKEKDTTMNEESDFLSPLPSSRLAKRVIAHRTSSSDLAENKDKKIAPRGDYMLFSPAASDLASPFHSRPGSPHPNRRAVKNALNKKLNRTRSVGTDLRRRATMRSFSRAVSPASNASSPGARRHPSLPNSQGHQKENQGWLVPSKFKQPLGQATPRRPSETSVPFVRESSFFDSVPEACSTPVQVRRISAIVPPTPGRDIDATPRVTLGARSSALFNANTNNFASDEPTPRARPSVENVAAALFQTEDSLFPDSPTIPAEDSVREPARGSAPLNTRRRLINHTSEDSILSPCREAPTPAKKTRPEGDALLISGRTKAEPESVTLVPPSSPAVQPMSPSSSEGDELRDMFSILGLDEDDHWLASSLALTGSTSPNTSSVSTTNRKKTKSSLSTRKPIKKEIINTNRGGGRAPASSVSCAPRSKRILIATESPSSLNLFKATTAKYLKGRPTIKMKILDKPIRPATDSSDEIDFLKRRSGQTSGSSDR
ncbi:hypothetical protein A7U60_g6509 [Sanghuangporus baumii]|uniref:Uncharacterized protein n=1 Tax=Sanghuangporus baumii TaxID=108892 RepID=A0A9Q5HUX6_SANBA|nr:hypothetical protein A7U60_g6509 [Sanghuangporus baumii]